MTELPSQKGSRTLPIAIVMFILSALIIIVVFGKQGQKSYDWWESYDTSKPDPYAASLLYDLLEASDSAHEVEIIDRPVRDFFADEEKERKGIYFMLGSQLYLGDADAEALLDWVGQGNNALICLREEIPWSLTSGLGWNDCDYWDGFTTVFAKSVELGFYEYDKEPGVGHSFKKGSWGGNSAEFSRYYKSIVGNRQWKLIDERILCYPNGYDTAYQDIYFLGGLKEASSNFLFDSLANFIKTPYGLGNVFFVTTPIVFSNYYMRDPRGLAYAEEIFSKMPKANIYWEKFSTIPPQPASPDSNLGQSPLSYILSQKALRWSWYILLIMTLLYVVFRAKRRQAFIKIIDPKENRSLEYSNMVAELHLQRSDHIYMARMIKRQFLAFIRERYHLSTANLSERFVTALSAKSGLDAKEVSHLVERLANLKDDDSATAPGEYTLQRLYNLITDFKHKCR